MNPFRAEEPSTHGWLLTTCLAGAAGSILIGAVLLGLVSEGAASNGAFASIASDQQDVALPVKALDPGIQTASLTPTPAPGGSEEETKAEGVMIVPERDLDGGFAYPEITSDSLPYGEGRTVVLESEISVGAIDTDNITTITKTPPPEPVDETIKLAKGDTLIDALVERGVTGDTAQALAAAIEDVFPVAKIKAGMDIDLTLDQQQDFYGRYVTYPVQVSFKTADGRDVKVEADEDGTFSAKLETGTAVADIPTPTEKPKFKDPKTAVTQFRTRTRVGSSLYATAKDNRIPDYIVTELTRAFSYDVDFQRQVKASDSFEVFYGNPLTGSSTKRKVLHYAQLTLGGVTKTYYRFTSRDGKTDFYDENGRGAQKSLLRTPVSGARLTSGFGMRRHPLLGYSKMHTGIDFGVPYGTPIRAAGSGTIEAAGRHGAYGIIVKLQHNDKYETLYAHMSRLAPGIRAGRRVNQGQIIGYVGSTGRSTGPHLHYEVRVADRPVNPMRITFAGGRSLGGGDLQRFRAFKSQIAEMMRKAPSATQVAQAGQ
jgi:murein DD-endopeptidase MepM/ murein hydrolase activator NlpD